LSKIYLYQFSSVTPITGSQTLFAIVAGLQITIRLKKNLLSTEMDFWRRAARTSRKLKVRNEVIREKWE
jgi:hypothetical protein